MCPVSVGISRSTFALKTGEAKLWGLLVGVNHYQDSNLPALRYSALDCQGLSEAIAEATQAFPQREIKIHHDAVTHLPTLEEVRASLQQVLFSAQPQDTVLFYFSGHGVLEPNSGQAVLCLADTWRDQLLDTGLSLQELLQSLGQCAARQQLVWLDACHSGGMTLRGARGETETELLNPTSKLVKELRKRAAESSGFYAFLSCDQHQQSWEFPQLGHGVFTYYLMQGLRGDAADTQGIIEADGLYQYVYYQTLQYIDKTNQQLRLINQQQRSRGDRVLRPEYPLQTPKRIVEGIGKFVLGLKPKQTELRYPRQALVVDGLRSCQTSLGLSKVLRGVGSFELSYWPQPGKEWGKVREVLQTCLQSQEHNQSTSQELSTALLYLRGRVTQTETGEALLVLGEDVQISRSWLRQALRHSSVTQQVIILDCPGAETLADWVEDLQMSAEQEQCLIAAASPPSEPERFAQALLETLSAADFQTGLSIAGWIAQLQQALSGTAIKPHVWLSGTQGPIEVLPGKTSGRGLETAALLDLGLCPYMGLRAFGEEDTQLFFGREFLTQRLINQLNQQAFLAVVGASGSGKSSLLHAGAIAQLRQGKQLPGSESWWVRSLRPGSRPLEALAKRLVDSGTSKEQAYQQQQIEAMLSQGVESFVCWLRSRPEPMVVLVVDQFEELFTLAPTEERQQFLTLVLEAINHASDRFKLMIALRTDFIAACLEIPALAQRLQQSNVLVPPALSDADYRQIITKPAEKVGLSVEPELVEVLLQELNHTAGDLPLLEFVLEQVWEHRQPGKLTLQVYQQQIGGLKGALERKAQAIYEGMDAKTQVCARWVFLALTQLGEGTEDTRRRVFKSELVVDKYPAALVEKTLQLLTAAKLVVVSLEAEALPVGQSRDWSPNRGRRSLASPGLKSQGMSDLFPQALNPNEAQAVTVEVAHEILIRHWSTLREWLEENRERLRSQRQIEQAALQWKRSGKQPDFLLQGVRLASAEEIYHQHRNELSEDVQRFIEAGLQARDRQQRQTKRRLRQAQSAAAAIAVLAVAAAVFGAVAYRQRQEARFKWIRSLTSLSEAQLLANQPLESLISGIKAGQQLRQKPWFEFGFSPTPDMQLKMVTTLQQVVNETLESNRLEGHSQPVNSISFSPNGQILASGSDDKTVRVWKPDGTLIATLSEHQDRIIDTAFGSNGTVLASASADGTINLWDFAAKSVRIALLTGDEITSIAFRPDSHVLATASRNSTIKLWNSTDSSLLRTLQAHTGGVRAISFSPDGQTLASAGEDGTIKLWGAAEGGLLQTFRGAKGAIASLEFSPDGQFIAAASANGEIDLVSVVDGSSQTFLSEPRVAVNSVSFSPNGKFLASASADGTVRLWQLDGTLLKTLKGHKAAVTSLDFSPDGQTLMTSSADLTIRLWSLRELRIPISGIYSASFGPDSQIAAAGKDGTVHLWQREGASGQLVKSLDGHNTSVYAVSFASGERILASGGDDNTVKLWNPKEGKLLHTLLGHQGPVSSIAFSPDGKLLASGSGDRTVKLWNPNEGKLLHTLLGHQGSVSSIAFSPDGKLLASGSDDRTVKLWQTDGTLLATLEHQGAIASLSFSPDGQTLASASQDNTIKLWQVNKETLLKTIIGHLDGVTSISFSPDGKTLASGGGDRTIKLWNSATGMPIKTLQGHRDPVRSVSFSPDGSILLSTSEAAGVQLWDFNLDRLLNRGCQRLQDYLKTNPKVSEDDRIICDKISAEL